MDLSACKLFTPHTNPETNVTFYILTEKVAPLQQGFYFVNSGMTNDGRLLWFYCAFPPSPGKTLGLVNFEAESVTYFPQTQFSGASPFIDPVTGEAYWTAREAVWTMAPDASDGPRLVNALPADLIRNRPVSRMATHLTRSVDGREFFIDATFGVHWVMGSLPLDGGDFQVWHRFDRNYNHAQFSPTDPDLVLFAEENHTDPITGIRIPIIDRMWLMRRGQEPRPVFDEPTRVSHEWWDADGRHVWCVWGNEAWRTNIETREVEHIEWPAHCWHAHSSRNNEYIIGDSNERFYRGCPSSVFFLNRKTGKHIKLVDNPEMTGVTGTQYHIDPHPRFCCDDTLATFTVTIRGEVDLAIARTADLIAQTS